MRQQGVGRMQMAAMRGYKNINIDHAPSRELIAEYAAILKDASLQEACESDLFWDRVVAVTEDGEDEVFDLTVPGTANWLADGIVSHNSGALEQDADLILLIYREEVYEKDTPRKGIADIIIAKQRNGPVGEFRLTFLGEFTKFENLIAEAYGEGVF
jgi:replicative DNA helicase